MATPESSIPEFGNFQQIIDLASDIVEPYSDNDESIGWYANIPKLTLDPDLARAMEMGSEVRARLIGYVKKGAEEAESDRSGITIFIRSRNIFNRKTTELFIERDKSPNGQPLDSFTIWKTLAQWPTPAHFSRGYEWTLDQSNIQRASDELSKGLIRTLQGSFKVQNLAGKKSIANQ